jgi:hypothetical protein
MTSDNTFDREASPGNASVRLLSVITCPECGASAEEEMPTDACIFFYECKGCRKLLRPLAGDCCVFCSFGSVKCPPVQLQAGCCAAKPGR